MDNEKEARTRSVELSTSNSNKVKQKPSNPESNANISKEDLKQNEEQKETSIKSLGQKSRSTASIQLEGRYTTAPDRCVKTKGVVSRVERPFKCICDLCDPIKHWYGQIFIALGMVVTFLLVLILLTFGDYWK